MFTTACTCRGQSMTSVIFLCGCLPHFVKQGLSLTEPEIHPGGKLGWPAGLWDPPCLSSHSHPWVIDVDCHTGLFTYVLRIETEVLMLMCKPFVHWAISLALQLFQILININSYVSLKITGIFSMLRPLTHEHAIPLQVLGLLLT